LAKKCEALKQAVEAIPSKPTTGDKPHISQKSRGDQEINTNTTSPITPAINNANSGMDHRSQAMRRGFSLISILAIFAIFQANSRVTQSGQTVQIQVGQDILLALNAQDDQTGISYTSLGAQGNTHVRRVALQRTPCSMELQKSRISRLIRMVS